MSKRTVPVDTIDNMCQIEPSPLTYDYMTTAPINCDEELKRLPEADYELCTALLTMLLREDYFSNGSFMKRYEAGQVKMILDRMLELLK